MARWLEDASELTRAEREVTEAIADREDDLVELVRTLVAFDTQVHPLEEPRQEADLQAYLGERLRRAGLSVRVWEPAAGSLPVDRLGLTAGYHFSGRPQLLAKQTGAGGGRSLLFNGHIDTVSVEPRAAWSVDPFAGEVRDGKLYGRGACDMKGGVGSMIFAVEMLRELGVELRGDLYVNTATDEESTGAGTLAAALEGARADGCVVTEPTRLGVWLGTRGSLQPTITVHGRSGHAGLRQPHFDDGGAVNAIEKLQFVLDALARLRCDWATRHVHPHLDPPDVVPVSVCAGEWIVTQPGTCTLRCHLQYLPEQADAAGWGTAVERELEAWLARVAQSDPWLARHPPELTWDGDVPPSHVPPGEPIAATTLGAAADLGLPGGVNPHNTWFDGATLARHGTPSIAFGPGDIARGHAADEHVPVQELVGAAQALTLIALRFCGTA